VNSRRQTRRAFQFRHRDENPVTTTPLQLCTFAQFLREESALTNCGTHNSFGFCFYENCRVVLAFLSKDLGSNLNWTLPSRALGSLFSIFARRAFHNSFPFRGIHTLSKNSRVAPWSWLPFLSLHPMESPIAYPLSFHALAHSSRPPKTQLLYFQAIAHSLRETTRGGGIPSLTEAQNEIHRHHP
jgi:hypothetical protein